MASKRQVAALYPSMAVFLTGAVSAFRQPAALEPPPSVAAIDQRLAETSEDPTLDDPTRAAVRGLYQQALFELEATGRWRMSALDFARRTTDAPAALAELEAEVAAEPPGERCMRCAGERLNPAWR